MSNPWNIDANGINLNDLDSNRLDSFIVKTKEIEMFLDSSISNKKMFIVGPKGVGKTLVLKAKSQLLRDNNKGLTFIPSDRLCEKIDRISVILSMDEINKFSDSDIWEKIWELSLLILIIRNFEEELPIEISNIINKARDLSEILTIILLNRRLIERIYKYVNTNLRPTVRDIQQVNQIVVFIDNIDEGFEKHVGFPLRDYVLGVSKHSNLSEKVWLNAQNSVMQVAKKICNSFKHIKIFLSIRSEAYINNFESTRLQLDSYATQIKYTFHDIKQIFINNIIATPQHQLTAPGHPDILSRLTGYNLISHSFVEDNNRNKKEEEIFKFIYRHTFQRPREIVQMGNAIITALSVFERTPDNVRAVVNEISYNLLIQLKTEIVPYFNDSVFEVLCQKIKKNIFTFETALQIYQEIKNEMNFDDVFSHFYRIGLIGYVDKDIVGNMMQTFLPVGQHSLSKEKIPEYKYFVLHPSCNKEMKRYHQNDFYDLYNIVGYGYPFKPNISVKKVKHVHFGLDRDSLAISIPELNKSKCLCIIQEPHPSWSALEHCDKITIEYNNIDKIELLVLHDKLNSIQKTRLLNAYNECTSILIYSSDINIIQKLIIESETISFSIFPKGIFEKINCSFTGKYIYCHLRVISNPKVKDINRVLNKKQSRCIPVLIDRFLISSEFFHKEHELLLKLVVESYGALVCPERSLYSMHPSNVIIRTKNKEEFKFYRKRQHRLVEGVYQLYKILKSNNIEPCVDGHPIVIFDFFIYIQVRILMSKVKSDVIYTIFGGKSDSEIHSDLLNFAYETINRTNILAKKYPNTGMMISIDEAKMRGVFPSDEYFYKYIVENNKLGNCKDVIDLQKMLNVKPLNKYKTVFISYSFKDSDKAKLFSNYLLMNGVKIFLFQIDDPHSRRLKSIMSEEISKFDKVLFIASKSSLTSNACQFEITQCRNKNAKTWDEILIPVRIDNYIFEIREFEIPDEFRIEYWKNIEHIKELNIIDYSSALQNFDCVRFQLMIRKLIEESL
jgi:hypothetical protein